MEVRRKTRDLLWIHTHYNKKDSAKGQDSALIVNKKRVKKHAEVYTPREAVEYMHRSAVYATLAYNDKFKHFQEALSISDKNTSQIRVGVNLKGKTFYDALEPKHFIELANLTTLEPCCGSGNFLETIITDKLRLVAYAYKKQGVYNPNSMSFYLSVFYATSTLYAGDLQPDNVKISRARVFHIVARACKAYYKRPMPLSIAKQFAYLLRMNILHTDFLLDGRIYPFFIINGDGSIGYVMKTFAGYHNGGMFSLAKNGDWVLDSNESNVFESYFTKMQEVYKHWAYLHYTYTYERQKIYLERQGFEPLVDMESHNPYKYAKGIVFSNFHKDMEELEIKANKKKAREDAENGKMPKELAGKQLNLF